MTRTTNHRSRVSRSLRLVQALGLACLLLHAKVSVAADAAEVVVYVRPAMDIDREASYPVDLLRLGLSRSGRTFDLRPSQDTIPQARAVLLLRSNTLIDVMWTVTSPERERLLLPVRIPIDRGIYGWRLFLIREGSQARFDAIADLGDLSALRAGQGHDWPDLAILRAAGLNVDAATSYDGLFEMLARGRIDYYPRALPEVWAEQEQRGHLSLAVEQSLLLRYPSAMYFFVSPDNPGLAEALQSGLERALEDGSFLALFDHYFGAAIERANLAARRVFDIDNPLLPDLVVGTDPAFWFGTETDR